MIADRKMIGVRVPLDMLDQLKTEASDNGYSLNAYLLMLIRKGRKQELESGRILLRTHEQGISAGKRIAG